MRLIVRIAAEFRWAWFQAILAAKNGDAWSYTGCDLESDTYGPT